jgi:hypothetical protein
MLSEECLVWHVLVQMLLKPELISSFLPAVVAGPGLRLLTEIEGR